jgi:uncharacterized repeat protein (TIGR03847 family)
VSESFVLRAPDLFTAGAVGPPGQRVFYLQAREGATLVTLKLEKEHVGALGEYFGSVLAKLAGTAEPASGPMPEFALVEPLVPAWSVRSIGVGYDQEEDRFVVVAEELREEEEENAPGDPASARFEVSRAQAATFAARARALIQAGRPGCPVCGRPKDPGGHVCPRANGHGRG